MGVVEAISVWRREGGRGKEEEKQGKRKREKEKNRNSERKYIERDRDWRELRNL